MLLADRLRPRRLFRRRGLELADREREVRLEFDLVLDLVRDRDVIDRDRDTYEDRLDERDCEPDLDRDDERDLVYDRLSDLERDLDEFEVFDCDRDE